MMSRVKMRIRGSGSLIIWHQFRNDEHEVGGIITY